MANTCTHLDTVADMTPSSEGCEDCLRREAGGSTFACAWAADMSAVATAHRIVTPRCTGGNTTTVR